MVRPFAGIGLGLRSEFAAELPATQRQVDWVEVVAEDWAPLGGLGLKILEANLERWALVPHSTGLSIGGPDPFDAEYLGWMRHFCRRIEAPFFSDHLGYSSVGGVQLHDVLALPFSVEAAEHTVRRIREVRQDLEVPLVFENPTYYAVMPGSTMDEAAFLRLVLEEGECGMLLDVNSLYVNSRNHDYDPYGFVDRMPLERVCELHLSGHDRFPNLVIDTQRSPIPDEVWALYRYVLACAGRMIPTLIEWDFQIPPLDQALDEVDRARDHAASVLRQAVAA